MKRIIYTSILAVVFAFNSFAQAVLPTSWSFATTTLPTGWTESGTAFYSASGNTPPAMKLWNTGDYLTINFASNPGNLTYYMAGNGFSGGTFTVQESDFGTVWTTLRTHTAPPNATYSMFTDVPQATSRFIRFIYTNKVSGNIGLDDVNIALGAATPAQEINVLQGATTIVSGGTHTMSSPVATMTPTNFTIENLGTANTLNIASATITGPAMADYSVATYPTTVAAASSGVLTVNFTPSVAGTRNAVLTIVSDDADESSYVINLNGIGGNFASEPTVDPTNLGLTNVKTYRITGTFVPAAGVDGYIVLRKKGSAITGVPTDGMVYQRGDMIGDGQVVFSGNYTSFVPNNIVANSNYYFVVFPYNGAGTYTNYKTNTPLTGNTTTPATMVSGTYYNGINSASATFVADLHALVNPHSTQFYSNYGTLMVKQFSTRDTTLNRRVVTCVYSGENKIYAEPFDFTANGFSREHTFPHSWMPTNPAQSLPEYNDYHHLFPTNQDDVNALRSNFPLGVVVNTTVSYLGAKYGTDANGNIVFEPRDIHKGDAARAMMYEAICYTTVSGNSWGLPNPISGSIPYGQDQDILKEWNLADAPDNYEIARNDYIDSLQNNRNPFVDNYNYACYIDFSNMTYNAPGCNLTVNELKAGEVSIYPNPSSDEVIVSFNDGVILAYSVVDLQGREVVSSNNVNAKSLTMNVANYSAGSYIVIVETSKGTAQQKMIVE
jgi:hypothetical protein